MNMNLLEIWGRGGLGNQVIEYLYGIAEAVDQKRDYKLFFSGKQPDERFKITHIEEKPTVDQILEFNRNIQCDLLQVKKVCYWDPHLTNLYFKHYQEIWSNHVKEKKCTNISEQYTAIHVRGTDKMKNIELANKLYDELFYLAKASNLPIKIATDDKIIAKHLCDRHNIELTDDGNNAVEDWIMLAGANHVFSIYSTFAYSILLVNPNIKYTIASYDNSYESYNYVDNEFLVLCQLQKYCRNLNILTCQSTEKEQDKGLVNCKMLNQEEMKDLQELSTNTKDIEKTINDICEFVSKPILPLWHKDEYAQNKTQKELKQYFNSANKNLYYKNLNISLFERGLYRSRQILSHCIHDQTSKITRRDCNLASNRGLTSKFQPILDREGVVTIPNFLPKDLFDKVREELDLREKKNIGSLSKNQASIICGDNFNGTAIRQIFLSKEFSNLIAYMTGYPLDTTSEFLKANTFFQKVEVAPKHNDIQTILHSDTFFPAFKFWYFPMKVNEDDSPFAYCKGTHIISKKRQELDNENVLDAILERGKGISIDHKEGSFRSTENEITQLGSKREKICNSENTLIIANVFGYHARSFAEKTTSRISVHGSLRYTNPFRSK